MPVSLYAARRPLYQEFASRLKDLLVKMLAQEAIDGTVEARAKTVESFASKINREGKSYLDPINEITDLCGVRVIVRTLENVEQVSALIGRELNVDIVNSVVKGEDFEVDRFGYRSTHLVVELSNNRSSLPEWTSLASLKAEIQIRTIGQHAWAAVEHALAYKAELDVPKELRRRLYRLSALFELADQEFAAISLASQALVSRYKEQLDKEKSDIELNVDSLRVYLNNSECVRRYVTLVEDLGVNVEPPILISRTVKMSNMAGIDSIGDLDDSLHTADTWGAAYITDGMRNTFGSDLKPGRCSLSLDGIVTILLIALYGSIFQEEMLQDQLGFGQAWRFINPAVIYNLRYPKPPMLENAP